MTTVLLTAHMPAPLAVDKEQVRMLVLSIGVREAARQMGLKEVTVCQWAARGKWLEATREAAAPRPHLLPPTMRPTDVSGVIKAPNALADVLKQGAHETRVGLTKYAARMAKAAAEDGNLEQAPLLKAVADIHAKIHPEAQGVQGMALGFFSIQVGTSVENEEAPVIDLPSESE